MHLEHLTLFSRLSSFMQRTQLFVTLSWPSMSSVISMFVYYSHSHKQNHYRNKCFHFNFVSTNSKVYISWNAQYTDLPIDSLFFIPKEKYIIIFTRFFCGVGWGMVMVRSVFQIWQSPQRHHLWPHCRMWWSLLNSQELPHEETLLWLQSAIHSSWLHGVDYSIKEWGCKSFPFPHSSP